MKKLLLLIFALCLFVFAVSACGPDKRSSSEKTTPNDSTEPTDSANPDESTNEEDKITDTVYLTIGSHKIVVKLERNEATAALVKILKQGDISYTARDYGGFEKVGDLGYTLPHSDKRMTTEAGDVILYSGDQIVLFYGSNSWSYTKLGKMQNLSAAEVKSILTESNSVTVTIGLK